MTMDAAKLKEAIKAARARADYDTRALAEYARGPNADQHRALAEAAEAHLSTLPQPEIDDHIVIKFDRSSGSIEVCKWLGGERLSKEDAEAKAKQWARNYPGNDYTAVCVTGPHRQTVPA